MPKIIITKIISFTKFDDWWELTDKAENKNEEDIFNPILGLILVEGSSGADDTTFLLPIRWEMLMYINQQIALNSKAEVDFTELFGGDVFHASEFSAAGKRLKPNTIT